MSTTGSLVRLIIFAIVTVILTLLLASTIGNISFVDRTTYRAVFSDVSGVIVGDDVRIAGVRVGTVSAIDILPAGPDDQNAAAQVAFTVDDDITLTTSTQAAVRYLNLIGQRYIGLLEGSGQGEPLEKNEIIPLEQTRTALDLTVLFAGFQPLFAALQPEDVNTFAMQIIATLQGEGGTVESLLANTASLTSTLADRDQLIGDVITNFSETLEIFNDRSGELSNTIVRLQQFLTGFAEDREAILGTFAEISTLADSTEQYLANVRPVLDPVVEQLGGFASNVADQSDVLDRTIAELPAQLNTINRTGSYGSFFNFFLCKAEFVVDTPAGPVNGGEFESDAPRCTPPPTEQPGDDIGGQG